jgi:hypothetical protein
LRCYSPYVSSRLRSLTSAKGNLHSAPIGLRSLIPGNFPSRRPNPRGNSWAAFPNGPAANSRFRSGAQNALVQRGLGADCMRFINIRIDVHNFQISAKGLFKVAPWILILLLAKDDPRAPPGAVTETTISEAVTKRCSLPGHLQLTLKEPDHSLAAPQISGARKKPVPRTGARPTPYKHVAVRYPPIHKPVSPKVSMSCPTEIQHASPRRRR